MALPNKLPFAFTYSMKFLVEIGVSGSFEFGSKNCEEYAMIDSIFLSINGVISITKSGSIK
jgi:hypothetical protein